MTSKQRLSILAHRWPAACKTQGWNAHDRAKRLAVISDAVGREIESMNDLDNAKDIDKVFAHLGMLADDVKRTAELTEAGKEFGQRRRYLWNVRKDASGLGGEGYVTAIARGKFGLTLDFTCIEDLTTEQLRQLMMTVHARAVKSRAKNAFLPSEEAFLDQVEFSPETEDQLVNEPF